VVEKAVVPALAESRRARLALWEGLEPLLEDA
jgi:hypothetical protein